MCDACWHSNLRNMKLFELNKQQFGTIKNYFIGITRNGQSVGTIDTYRFVLMVRPCKIVRQLLGFGMEQLRSWLIVYSSSIRRVPSSGLSGPLSSSARFTTTRSRGLSRNTGGSRSRGNGIICGGGGGGGSRWSWGGPSWGMLLKSLWR